MGFVYLAIGSTVLLFPQLAYWMHYNWGDSRLDDVLTGFQANLAIIFALKSFVFETLIQKPVHKLIARALLATLFVIQWPLMLSMFYKAPIPIAHALVECFEVYLVFLAYKVWRGQ